MNGAVSGWQPSLTTWVTNLDKMHQSNASEIRGTVKHLHIKTGFESFVDAVKANILRKKDPAVTEGMSARIRTAIQTDFGKEIADKVFAKYEHASKITAGDLRSMLKEAQGEQVVQSLIHAENEILVDQFVRPPSDTVEHAGKQILTTLEILTNVMDSFAGRIQLTDDLVAKLRDEVLEQSRKDILDLGKSSGRRVDEDDVTRIIRDTMTKALEAVVTGDGVAASLKLADELLADDPLGPSAEPLSGAPLTDELPKMQPGKSIQFAELFKDWALAKTDDGASEGPQATRVRNMAQAFTSSTPITDLLGYMNDRLKVHEGPPERPTEPVRPKLTNDPGKDQPALEKYAQASKSYSEVVFPQYLQKLYAYEDVGKRVEQFARDNAGSKSLDIGTQLAELALTNQTLSDLLNKRGDGIFAKTNTVILKDNLAKLGTTDPAAALMLSRRLDQVGSLSILAIQIGPRINLLSADLTKNLKVRAEAERELAEATQQKDTDPERFKAATEAVEKAARTINSIANEVNKVMGEARENYEAIASLFQNPALLKGVSPDCARMLQQHGQQYGRLAEVFGDPAGPAQGLLALAMLACADPKAAIGLVGA